MSRRIELEFRRALLPLIGDADHVLAAVSGGADSVALAHLLARLTRGRELSITIAHLDHAMRRGSRADRRFVEHLARDLGLPCHAERREVPALRRRGESPEEAARRVRRAFLLESRKATGATWIVTGHTLDDQAETVLMRLARGAGPAALAGMRPLGPGPFVRPLLGLERSELRGWLTGRGLAFRDDPSNADLRFDRNRVRRLLIPELSRTLNPRAARHLVKAAELLHDDASYLDGLAEERFRELAGSDRRGLTLDAAALAGLPGPLATRCARTAMAAVGIDRRRIATRHIEALLDLAAGAGGRELDLPGGFRARRIGRRIRLLRRTESR